MHTPEDAPARLPPHPGKPAPRRWDDPDGRAPGVADHRAMSTNPNFQPAPSEPSGEQVFFVMAIAFWVLVAAIVAGAFMPLVAGLGMIFAILAVVLVIVGIFLARLLSDG